MTKGRKHKKSHRPKLPKLQKERVKVMQNEVERLRQKLQKTSQEVKDKLQQEKPIEGGSRMSHK